MPCLVPGHGSEVLIQLVCLWENQVGPDPGNVIVLQAVKNHLGLYPAGLQKAVLVDIFFKGLDSIGNHAERLDTLVEIGIQRNGSRYALLPLLHVVHVDPERERKKRAQEQHEDQVAHIGPVAPEALAGKPAVRYVAQGPVLGQDAGEEVTQKEAFAGVRKGPGSVLERGQA